jgi:DNA-binding NarL/FixJ family response regulator
MIRVAIVDRHPTVRAGLDAILGAQPDMVVVGGAADAIADKAGDVRELLQSIRTVARGEGALPRITPRLQTDAALRLEAEDHAIFAMRLAGTAPGDIAATIGLSAREVDVRSAAILAALA